MASESPAVRQPRSQGLLPGLGAGQWRYKLSPNRCLSSLGRRLGGGGGGTQSILWPIRGGSARKGYRFFRSQVYKRVGIS